MTSRKSSILKPLRVREPLQDLSQLLPNNDEEETTTTDTHKRRVSFACVNKIKEFEAGAECTTLLHTPAYDERFSISSDSYQSSLCESRDKSIHISNIETTKSTSVLNYSRANNENVEIVEVDLLNVTRGAPSPGKMSTGDSSMDITNMIVPREIIEYESETEGCYPLNLTKSFASVPSNTQPRDYNEDTLESSSMETTEALPCLITETMRTSQSEIFTQETETSIEEEILFDLTDEPASPEQIVVRKSEIFLRDKPAPKRLSAEMIDPEELDIVNVKRRSLTNDSRSDESNADIEQPVQNDRRKSVLPLSHVDNQNIKSLIIREEKSTVINIDNTHHTAEVKQIKNVNVDVAYENELITGHQENRDIVQNEDKPCQVEKLSRETSSVMNKSVEPITEGISEPEATKSSSDDLPPQKETRLPVSAKKSSIPVAVQSKIAPLSRKSLITIADDNKTVGNISRNKNISVNDTINVSRDMDITTAFHKTTHETFIKGLSQNNTNDGIKDMELTTALHKNTQEIDAQNFSPNKTNVDIKDIELSTAFQPNSQDVHVECISQNKTNDATKDMELTHALQQNSQEVNIESVSQNKTNDATRDMELTNAQQQNSHQVHVESVSQNKTNDATRDMELTNAQQQNSQQAHVESVTQNKTIDATKDTELSISLQKNTQEICVEGVSPVKINDVTNDMEITAAVVHDELPLSLTQNIVSDEINNVISDKKVVSGEKVLLNFTSGSENASQESTATPPTVVQEIFSQSSSINKTNDVEIAAAVHEEMEELISLVCSQDENNKSLHMNVSSIKDASKIEILETSFGCENTSSMIAECDVEDVMSNLKAVNITGDLTMCISQDENEVIIQENDGSSLEIIKNSSAGVIQVMESSEESEKSIIFEEIVQQSNHPESHFQEERSKVFANVKKSLKREMSHWSIQSKASDKWIFDALWNRLRLKIIFNDKENSCTAELHFIPKTPTIEEEELKKKAAQGDEVLKISAGPIIRKYKPKLDLFCSKVQDVIHLLQILSPDIIFAQKFAENFAHTLLAYDIKLSRGVTSFYVSSFKNEKMVKIEVSLKMLERLSLSSINVVQMIGKVDENLVHDVFCTAGRDYNFFSLFMKNLWEKIDS